MKTSKRNDGKNQEREGSSLLLQVFFLAGSAGLLLAMATDAVAVLGRHTGFALLGSIEIIQAAVVVLASASMIYASRGDFHARIRILVDRVSDSTKGRFGTIANIVSVLYFILLAVGCVWVCVETWPDHERTELLHIPFRWLRLLLALSVVLMGGFFARRLLGGQRK